MTFRLDDRRNADLRRREDGGNFRQHAGFVHHAEPDVIARNNFIHRHDAAGLRVRNERRDADFSAVLQIERGIGHVAQHGAGRRVFSRAAAVEQRVADDIAAHEARIEHAVDAGQHVRIGDERRIDGNLHAGFFAGNLLGDAEQLDVVAELFGELHVEAGAIIGHAEHAAAVAHRSNNFDFRCRHLGREFPRIADQVLQ